MPQRDPREILAENMRRLRAARGWSQEELGERSGIHRTHIGALERVEKQSTLRNLLKLADAFGVEAWELLKPVKATLRRKTVEKR